MWSSKSLLIAGGGRGDVASGCWQRSVGMRGKSSGCLLVADRGALPMGVFKAWQQGAARSVEMAEKPNRV